MKAVSVNISGKMFGGSEVLTTFEMRTDCRFSESQSDIFHTADKAASLRAFYFGSLRRFAKLQGGAASLYLYIHQILSRMRTDKNLKNDALGASTSTRSSAKTVSKNEVTSTSNSYSNYLTRGAYISLKGQLNKALKELSALRTPEHIYRVRMTFNYNSMGVRHFYEIDKQIQARSKEEAFGKVYSEMSPYLPDFNLPLKSAGGVQLCTLIK